MGVNRSISGWIEAFHIFAKYVSETEYFEIAAEHDVIYAGPDQEKVTTEDKARLKELGWIAYGDGFFQKFV